MLFVGNDFERKGGLFLLELFDKHLQGKYRLRIVSGDPVVRSIESRDGLEVYSDITYERLDELIRLYQTSDVFVFPTFLDAFGIVIGEAIATAMPVVARHVGGIPDFVKDGQTGRLMPYGSGMEEWRDVLLALADDPEERARLGRNGRALAEEKMSATAVRDQVRSAVDVLREKVQQRRAR